jgi:hypothetical protein
MICFGMCARVLFSLFFSPTRMQASVQGGVGSGGGLVLYVGSGIGFSLGNSRPVKIR